jgi:ABC-2 type transport system ATP-binding protein
MIARGRQVLYGDLQEIKRRYATDAVRVQSSANYAACPLVARAEREEHGTAVAVHLRDGATSDEFLRWLVTSGASVECFERITPPLEEIFVRVAQAAPVLEATA